MPPESKMTDQKIDMTVVENAMLRNNDYLIEKMTKTLKEEIGSVNLQVSQHNGAVLKQITDIAQTVGLNTGEINTLKTAVDVQSEKLKGLNAKIATVGAVCAALGGFFTFLIDKLMGH